MSGGKKTVVINELERAVSNDINRLQAFAESDDATLWQYVLDAVSDEDHASGTVTTGGGANSPLRAAILNGFCARPEIGGVNCFVDPGVMYAVQVDAVPSLDDSVYKYIRDNGVGITGQLVLTANASGSTRVDVIECSRNADHVEETDNRDIYNPVTGLFTATSVTKAKADRLTYRIRLGTPGAGMPVLAQDWLPLAVVKVPNAATTWDACDLWDVRPLVSDMHKRPFQVVQNNPRLIRQYLTSSATYAPASKRMSGMVEVVAKDGRVLGGNCSVNDASAPYVDLSDATNVIEPGFAIVGARPWYVYLLTPFLLPRWCKYSPATAGVRVPRGIRGIPVFTQKAPNFDGTPSIAVSLPTGLGLGSTSSVGQMVLAGAYDSNGVNIEHVTAIDGKHYLTDTTHPGLVVVGTGTVTTDFPLIDNVTHPVNAKMLRLRLSFAASAGPADYAVEVMDPTNTFIAWQCIGTVQVSTGAITVEVDVPLIPNQAAAPLTRHIKTSITGQTGVNGLSVMGWTLYP